MIFLKVLFTICHILLFMLNGLMAFHSAGAVSRKTNGANGGDVFMLAYFIFSALITLITSAVLWVV